LAAGDDDLDALRAEIDRLQNENARLLAQLNARGVRHRAPEDRVPLKEQLGNTTRVIVEGLRPADRSGYARSRLAHHRRACRGRLPSLELLLAMALQVAPVRVLADREALLVQRLDDLHMPNPLLCLRLDDRHQAAQPARLRPRFKLLDGNLQVARHCALELHSFRTESVPVLSRSCP